MDLVLFHLHKKEAHWARWGLTPFYHLAVWLVARLLTHKRFWVLQTFHLDFEMAWLLAPLLVLCSPWADGLGKFITLLSPPG